MAARHRVAPWRLTRLRPSPPARSWRRCRSRPISAPTSRSNTACVRRCCARELAVAAGGDDALRADAYHLGLVHAIGCTSDAHEAAAAYGDDRPYRSDFATIDSARPNELMAFLWRRTAESRSPHVVAFAGAVLAGARRARSGLTAHCEVGQRFAQRLGLPESVAARCGTSSSAGTARACRAGSPGARSRGWHGCCTSRATPTCTGAWAARGAVREAFAARAGGAYDPELADLARAELPASLAALDEQPAWEAAMQARPRAARGAGRRRTRRGVPGRSASSPTSSRSSRSGTRRRSPSWPRRPPGGWGWPRTTSPSCAAPASCTTSGAWPSPPASGRSPRR